MDVDHIIAGRPVPADRPLVQRNPSRLAEVVTVLPNGDAATVAEAAAEASRAQAGWAAAGIEARADLLQAWAGLLRERQEALAALIARETGKTLRDARAEVGRAARIAGFFAGEALRLPGESLASVRPGVRVEVRPGPVGVVGAITPWNFPIAIPVWKIAPALAFGNAVVWKPSECASGTASAIMDALAECLGAAGLPPGLVNLVHGDGQAGRAVAADPAIDAVSFTGSERAGADVAVACAARRAVVQLELGGSNGHLVLRDADIEGAARCIVDAAFFAAGQRCTATSRIVVEAPVADALVDAILAQVRGLTVGDATSAETQIGPLVSPRQKEAVLRGVAAMRDCGRVDRLTPIAPDRDCFVTPALFDGCGAADPIARTEIFGPVAGVFRVADYEEGLALINDAPGALSAGLSTRSAAHMEDFRGRARAGMVMVNLPTAGVDYHVPFGGDGTASHGPREQGRAASGFYTKTKTLYTRP